MPFPSSVGAGVLALNLEMVEVRVSEMSSHSPRGGASPLCPLSVQQVQAKSGTQQATKQLREELDLLKAANQELKSRLETLEAKSSTKG